EIVEVWVKRCCQLSREMVAYGHNKHTQWRGKLWSWSKYGGIRYISYHCTSYTTWLQVSHGVTHLLSPLTSHLSRYVTFSASGMLLISMKRDVGTPVSFSLLQS